MVSDALVYGLGAALCWGTSELAIVVVSRRIGAFWTVLTFQAASLVLMISLLIVIGVPRAPTAAEWVALLALGPVATVTYLAFYRALELGPIAIVSPIVAGYGALTLLLALTLLSESLSSGQAVGIAVVVVAIVVAAYEPAAGRTAQGAGGISLALVAMTGFGLYVFGLGALSEGLGWVLPILVSRGISIVLLAVVARSRDERVAAGWDTNTAVLVAVFGTLEGAGYLLFNRGAELGHVAITGAVSSAYPVFAIVAGLIYWRERVPSHQLAGAAGVLAGLIVLALT